jgi:hypothetical protein
MLNKKVTGAMSHSPTRRCSVLDLCKLLQGDKFLQLLAGTTLFRDISPTELPVDVLDQMFTQMDLIELKTNEPFKKLRSGGPDLYEILSGYVMIYDRPNLPIDKKAGTQKDPPPALLAWRVPGELLGDFKFSLPHDKFQDHFVATDPCQLLVIPHSLVGTIARYQPRIYLNLGANLAGKAVKARVRAQILRLPTIECKIAKLFLELLNEREFDPTITDRSVVNGTFHVRDIGAFLGHGETSTTKGIRMLINNGVLIHYQNERSGRFEVPDKERLRQYLDVAWLKATKKPNQEQR